MCRLHGSEGMRIDLYNTTKVVGGHLRRLTVTPWKYHESLCLGSVHGDIIRTVERGRTCKRRRVSMHNEP